MLIASSKSNCFTAASSFPISGRYNEEFLFPLYGTGARYGQSVSRTIFSIGIYSTASFNFLALVN